MLEDSTDPVEVRKVREYRVFMRNGVRFESDASGDHEGQQKEVELFWRPRVRAKNATKASGQIRRCATSFDFHIGPYELVAKFRVGVNTKEVREKLSRRPVCRYDVPQVLSRAWRESLEKSPRTEHIIVSYTSGTKR